MKIYIDFENQVITKKSNENVMLGDIYSNVFELLFYNFGTDTNWFPTLSQLAPNGRSAGDFSADALGIGETHNYTEDGVNYLKYDFTIGDGYVNMSGRSMFYIWVNRTTPVMSRKGIAKVNVNIDASTDTPFITDPLFNPKVKTYINACVAEIGDGSPKYFDTAANIALLTEDKGLAVATDTGHLYYWDSTSTSTTKYIDSGLVYNDLSAYYTKTQADSLLNDKADKSTTYTKTESDNRYAQLGADNTFTGDNDFRGDSLFSDDINQAYGNFSTQGNVEAQSFTKDGTNLDDIYASKSNTYTKTETDTLLNNKADKSTTYTKTETDTLLNTKADKTNTYTKSEVDTALNDKVNTSDFDTLDGRVDDIEDDIDTLKSVQNVVDIVATYSALQSYDTSDLGTNDKIQVIADETHSGASTIYNWNGSAWEYVGAYGTNSYTKTETLEQIDLHKLVNKTYSELATLKSGNNLVAGQLYRITDYVTKTNGVCNGVANDVRSMEHPFDIVLRAISNNKFSENARVLLHSGDTYFANSNLNSWQLWYCFDNDSVRFEWADTLTGKGVIYRMIDEFGNDLPYDFKNIQFKRYKITATTDSRHSNAVGKYLGFSGNYNCTSDSTDYQWYFTFSKRSDGSDLSLTETTAPSYTNCYYVKEVKIGEYLSDTPNYRGIQALNNIVFECDNIVVDVQMGVCSNHNTFIGNKDITYAYFKEMCRNNIVYGEMSHARADECFEQNIMGDFVALSQYTLCWNKFSHHFAKNIAVQMQSNDFEAQVSDCKFPENFTRNHIFNMWGSVDASTHDTFNRCELGLFSYTTLSGGGTWDGVYGISLDHCTIKIANLFGSKLGRMEYVSISEGVNNFNVLNLTVGALFGSSSKVLTIALTDLASYQIASVYEKKIDFANETVNNLRGLIYTWAKYSVAENIVDYGAVRGTISSVDGTVTWTVMDSIYSTMTNMVDGKMNKANPTGTGSISMNDGNASGTSSYANGSGANASGSFSRAIGFGAQASGSYSTAIIGNASGSGAIAIGNMANASGDKSKALGDGAKAKGDNQTVIGKFNISDTSSLEIVGNGAYMNTSNARLLDADGNEYLKGDLYINTTFTKDANGDLVSKKGTSITELFNNFRWELGSHTLDVTTDTDVAFSKSVPSDTIGCQINQIGGMSYKSENLLELANDNSYGIVYGNNFVVGQTYTLKLFTKVFRVKVATSSSQPALDCLVSQENASGITTVTFTYANGSNWNLYLWGYGTSDNPNAGLLSDISTVQPMIVSGTTAPTSYKPYFEGIRNSAVTSVVSKDSNNTTVETLSIPTAIQNLDGYGWGINDNCYNYIDFDRKVFVKKVTRTKLQDLNFEYIGNNAFAVSNIGIATVNAGIIVNAICNKYNVVAYNTLTGDATLICISGYSSDRIYLRDTNYTDATTLKNSFTNDDYLYYELATPIETDISAYLTTDTIDVEPLGTLEFTNTYNNDVPSDIDYLIEEVKA